MKRSPFATPHGAALMRATSYSTIVPGKIAGTIACGAIGAVVGGGPENVPVEVGAAYLGGLIGIG